MYRFLLTPVLLLKELASLFKREDDKHTHTHDNSRVYLYPWFRYGIFPIFRSYHSKGNLDKSILETTRRVLGEKPIDSEKRKERYTSRDVTVTHYTYDQRENERENVIEEYPCWIFPLHGI